MRRRLSSEKATPAVAFCFALNHLLDAEPWARERLAPFAGESLELRAPPLPAVRLTILPAGRVAAGGAEPALVVTLRPEALGGLVRGGEHFMRSVEVAGNATLAAEIMALARHLRWDMEEDLSRLIGDVGRNTRSMFTNRDGRPRSAIKHAVPIDSATKESRADRRRSGAYASPSVDDAPAIPPHTKYAGMYHFHTGALRTGTS